MITFVFRRPSSTSSLPTNDAKTSSVSLNMHDFYILSAIECSNNLNKYETIDGRNTVPNVGSINFWHMPPVRKDDQSKRVASYRIVRLLLESRHFSENLLTLLSARDTDNLTPFMLAVKLRAYAVAQFIYNTIQVRY